MTTPDKVGKKIMETKKYYICSNCGFSEFNRCDWCDLGCGEDFNEMIEIKGLGDFLSKALNEQRAEQKNKVIKLKQEYANTPIEERGNGFDWLNCVEKEL